MNDLKTVTLPNKCENDTGAGEQTATSHAVCSEEQVRERAYHKWDEVGCPCGDGAEFWLQAEAELIAEIQPASAIEASET